MPRFVRLTSTKRDEPFVINLDTIEYMIPNNAGTALFTVSHHTKYEVRESMTDILAMLDDVGLVLTVAKNSTPTVKTENNESVQNEKGDPA